MKLNIWKLLLEFGKHAWQHVDAVGLVGGDDEFAAGLPLEFVDRVLGLLAQLQNPLGILAEDSAGGRQGNPGAQTVEQLGVQFLLQLPDLGADRRLGPVAGLRRLGEALQPDDLQKCVKLIEIHFGNRIPDKSVNSRHPGRAGLNAHRFTRSHVAREIQLIIALLVKN